VALGGGVAAYFASLAAIRLRCGERPRPTQLAAAALAVIAIPIATEVPALATLSGLAAVTVAAALTDRILPTGGTPSGTASSGTPAGQ
jgi:hypothetical protein